MARIQLYRAGISTPLYTDLLIEHLEKSNHKPRSLSIDFCTPSPVATPVPQPPIPFPPISYVKELKELSPGGADRLFQMLQKEAEYRRGLEEKIVQVRDEEMRLEYEYARRGQIFGFILSILFLSGALWLAVQNHPAVASCLGLSGFVTINRQADPGSQQAASRGAAQDGLGLSAFALLRNLPTIIASQAVAVPSGTS